MRLVICGVGVVIGLVMAVIGVRLWRATAAGGGAGPSFATSAALMIFVGVAMIALSSRLFLDTRRAQLLAVKPLAERNLYPP